MSIHPAPVEFRPAAAPAGARTLPGRSYCSEAVFAAETERLFAAHWLAVARAQRLPHPGDFLTVPVAGESPLLLRGGDGRPRAFYNVCRHRGARLCETDAGRHRESLRCPYHGWTYGLDGRLVAAPHLQGARGFDPAEYPLHPVALTEWEGFLFVNLDPEPEPFSRALAPLLNRFTAWNIGGLRRAHRIEYDVRANWKLLIENYSECYHCTRIHPQLCRLSPPRSGRNDLLEGPVLGGYMDLRDGLGSMTTDGSTARPSVGTVAGADLARIYYSAVFPTLLLSLHPDYVMAHFLTPLEPRRTRIVCEWYFEPETIARPNFDPSDAVEFWDRTNRQDWHVCELTQLGVASRAYTPGPLTDAEGLLWAFGQHYRRRMGEE